VTVHSFARASPEPAAAATRRYAIHAPFASGETATVHFGTLLGPAGFSRVVAIKRLHPHCAKDAELVALLLDEARLAARIRHPNVVSTLDVVTTDANVLIVTEYVRGESLANLLGVARARDMRVPAPIAASLIASLLYGLHAVHQACNERPDPRLYRDVSPANVLIDPDGAARWINVVRVRGGPTTRAGAQDGIDQFKRHADLVAGSVLFWECLTGRRLCLDGGMRAETIDPPSKYAPSLGAHADQVVLRGLARAPADGYATARAMALAIETTMPTAPAAQVGAWVEELAHDVIAQRTRQVAQIEGATSSGDAKESVYATARLPAPGVPHARAQRESGRNDDVPHARAERESGCNEDDADANRSPIPTDAAAKDARTRVVWPYRKIVCAAAAAVCLPLVLASVQRAPFKPRSSGVAPNGTGSNGPCAPTPSCAIERDPQFFLESAPAESILGQREMAPKAPPQATSAPHGAASARKPPRSIDKDEIL
jgi:hypothetical protein